MSTPGIPPILYGTAWKKDRTAELVTLAIACGFRGIDTACQPKHYDEPGVGAGIAASGVPGESLYVQLKLTPLGGRSSFTRSATHYAGPGRSATALRVTQP